MLYVISGLFFLGAAICSVVAVLNGFTAGWPIPWDTIRGSIVDNWGYGVMDLNHILMTTGVIVAGVFLLIEVACGIAVAIRSGRKIWLLLFILIAVIAAAGNVFFLSVYMFLDRPMAILPSICIYAALGLGFLNPILRCIAYAKM